MSITLTPATADIYVAPSRDASPSHPMTVQLKAVVHFNDGTMDDDGDDVEWSSSEGDRARVDDTGLVTAGVEPGEVEIEVESEDGFAKATAVITVRDDSALEVTVD